MKPVEFRFENVDNVLRCFDTVCFFLDHTKLFQSVF